MNKYMFRNGDLVKVGFIGTDRFPIPARYAGRTATVVGRHRVGRTAVYEVVFPSNRRVTPLPVLQSDLLMAE